MTRNNRTYNRILLASTGAHIYGVNLPEDLRLLAKGDCLDEWLLPEEYCKVRVAGVYTCVLHTYEQKIEEEYYTGWDLRIQIGTCYQISIDLEQVSISV